MDNPKVQVTIHHDVGGPSNHPSHLPSNERTERHEKAHTSNVLQPLDNYLRDWKEELDISLIGVNNRLDEDLSSSPSPGFKASPFSNS
jgi:hypothetical protein